MQTNTTSMAVAAEPQRSTLQAQLRQVGQDCTRCQRCVRECRFLQQYGDPKKLADNYDPSDNFHLGLPFECSLCGLCNAVCPERLDLVTMFLEMRRETFSRGQSDYPEHRGLLNYERKGTSKRYSWYALPDGCDTVFFPGCSLTGSRPKQTLQAFEILQQRVPHAGIVLDCCTKPSHDLGREDYFHAMFGEMKQYLLQQGVKRVLVACPNCEQVFRKYAAELETRTIYEFLDSAELPVTSTVSATVNVHDPCVSRFSGNVHSAVRSLAEKKGLQIVETKHSRETTICCGEGGAVGCIAPDLAQGWSKQRGEEAGGNHTLTYCAGCAHNLSGQGPTSHILDVLFSPQEALAGQAKVSKAPFTYLNRLKLKKDLQNNLVAKVTRERTFTAGEQQKSGLAGKLLILGLIIGAIFAIRATGATAYLEQQQLRGLIENSGALAPLLYMALYCIAPALFLPGLPISIVGGILFGPVWGVIYTISSATVGACVAFLVSRYIARDWIESKLKSPRWRHLDEKAAVHGWKMVAFTRLIPLFPFNLLNYAFGLTKVKFSHYALATFLFMLPGTIAFITFSSSLLDLLRGKISPTFLIGLGLMVLVSLLPMFVRRYQLKKESRAQTPAEEPVAPAQYSFKKSLKIKIPILLAVAALAWLAVFLGNKYFWAINAYVYTAEFHLLFLLKNLQTANLELLTEYFGSMGPSVMSLALLLFANLLQGFWLPLSKPVLVPAQVSALGAPLGFIFSFAGLLLGGVCCYLLGRFLFGDLRPLLRDGKLGPARGGRSLGLNLLLSGLAAIPLVPMPVMPVLAGTLRLTLQQTCGLMLIGLLLRVSLLLLVPTLFL